MCSLWRADNFDVLYGGLREKYIAFFLSKNINFFTCTVYFFKSWVIKPWIWIRTRIETNADPEHCPLAGAQR